MSIPKKIHYCWFGNNPKPDLAKKCMDSWKKFCPNYDIIEWNESNFDISKAPLYVREAYKGKKWAFVTDYVRLKVVYDSGGIYLDTDVELLKPLDDLLNNSCFFGCEGLIYVSTGLGFGAEKGFPFLLDNMKIYEDLNPVGKNGGFESNPCPYYTTRLLEEQGVQFPIKEITEGTYGMTIYPNEYFNPLNWKTKELLITEKTYSVHHFSGSWLTSGQKKGMIQKAKKEAISKKYGEFVAKVYDFYFWSKKENGGSGVAKQIVLKLLRR